MTSECVAVNQQYKIDACTNKDNPVCFLIDTISSSKTSLEIKIDSQFTVGTTYYFKITLDYGAAIATSSYFKVGEPSIEIISWGYF